MKTCYKCDTVKENVEFFKNRAKKDGLSSYCKTCVKRDKKSTYTHGGELMRRFNITKEQYEQMALEQDYRCRICGRLESVVDKRTGLLRRLAVDHCHTTGKIRGLLCFRCNRGIGLFDDDPVTLQQASEYLTVSRL